MGNKVFISGYAKPTFFNGGFQYRNFSDGLVGNQQTNLNNSSLFSLGNFVVTTNYSPKTTFNYQLKNKVKYYTLDDLTNGVGINNDLLNKLIEVEPNLDWNSFKTYAYFGSLTEFLRVSLENVIMNFPASIKSQTFNDNEIGNTIEQVQYLPQTNSSKFRIPIKQVRNPFKIDLYEIPLTQQDNDLRILKYRFNDYVLNFNNLDYKVIGFSGLTNNASQYIYFEVEGDLSSITQSNDFHIKPNSLIFNSVYKKLNKFEQELINIKSDPIYQSKFTYDEVLDNGLMVKREVINNWPITDGYNIDFENREYIDFVSKLLDVTNKLDEEEFDIIRNFLVAKSISEFDTSPTVDGDIVDGGKKMVNLLRIFGREFDERKKYIDGLANANKITYNKKENTPDVLIKDIARNLGWTLTSNMVDNEIINNYLDNNFISVSGGLIKYSAIEAEQELWRRLVLNSSWLFKSKGTRKAIEFLLKFIGTPKGLISFNEYIYKAKEKVDYDLVLRIAEKLGLTSFETQYRSYGSVNSLFTNENDLIFVDDNGYPNPINQGSVYFQNNGGWWRETGGSNANQLVLNGNNPHIGEYDNGFDYINRFSCLFPNIEPQLIRNALVKEEVNSLFLNYSSGTINDLVDLTTYVGVTNTDGVDISSCVNVTSEIIDDPKPEVLVNDCNCDIDYLDQALKINFSCRRKIPNTINCNVKEFSLNESGQVLFTLIDNSQTFNLPTSCCAVFGFQSGIDQMGNTVCLWKEKAKCPNLTILSHDANGYAVFQGNPDKFSIIYDPNCCETLNNKNASYTPIQNPDGGFYCKRRIIKTPIDLGNPIQIIR